MRLLMLLQIYVEDLRKNRFHELLEHESQMRLLKPSEAMMPHEGTPNGGKEGGQLVRGPKHVRRCPADDANC